MWTRSQARSAAFFAILGVMALALAGCGKKSSAPASAARDTKTIRQSEAGRGGRGKSRPQRRRRLARGFRCRPRAHGARDLGIGAHGFTVGPYVSFTSSIGLFKGSSLGVVQCAEATMIMTMFAGVGYTIPKIVARIINIFLSVVGIKHEIEAQGSLSPSASIDVHNGTTTLKGCHADSG